MDPKIIDEGARGGSTEYEERGERKKRSGEERRGEAEAERTPAPLGSITVDYRVL